MTSVVRGGRHDHLVHFSAGHVERGALYQMQTGRPSQGMGFFFDGVGVVLAFLLDLGGQRGQVLRRQSTCSTGENRNEATLQIGDSCCFEDADAGGQGLPWEEVAEPLLLRRGLYPLEQTELLRLRLLGLREAMRPPAPAGPAATEKRCRCKYNLGGACGTSRETRRPLLAVRAAGDGLRLFRVRLVEDVAAAPVSFSKSACARLSTAGRGDEERPGV